MIVKPPYPVLIKGIPHAPHPVHNFAMWQLAEGGEYTRCNKKIIELEIVVQLKYKLLPVTEEKLEIESLYNEGKINDSEHYDMLVAYLVKCKR